MTDNGRIREGELLDVALPAHRVSVPAARHAIHETLGDAPAADVAELVVSELVTNAILHARKECHLRVSRHDAALRIEVTDPSPDQPAPGPALPGGLEEEGRGLRIVQALAQQYGVEREEGDGKTVWVEIALQPDTGEVVSDRARLDSSPPAALNGYNGRMLYLERIGRKRAFLKARLGRYLPFGLGNRCVTSPDLLARWLG